MTTKQVEDELVELEKRYWQAIKDKNVDAAMRLTDDGCFVAGAQGVARLDKQKLGAMMQSATYTLNAFRVSDDVQVRLVRDDVAIVAYKVHEDLTVDGQPVSLDASDASTWV